jgi:hypothetical protein
LESRIIPAHNIPVAHGGLSKPNDPDFDGVDAPAKEVVIKASEKTTIEIPATEVLYIYAIRYLLQTFLSF